MQYIVAIGLGGMSAKGAPFTPSGGAVEEKLATDKDDGFEGTLKSFARSAIARAYTGRIALLSTK